MLQTKPIIAILTVVVGFLIAIPLLVIGATFGWRDKLLLLQIPIPLNATDIGYGAPSSYGYFMRFFNSTDSEEDIVAAYQTAFLVRGWSVEQKEDLFTCLKVKQPLLPLLNLTYYVEVLGMRNQTRVGIGTENPLHPCNQLWE